MTAEEALSTLLNLASTSRYQPQVHQLRYYVQLIKAAMGTSDNSEKLRELKAESTELTMRVAELEDELAEARKPKRRTRKKNEAT